MSDLKIPLTFILIESEKNFEYEILGLIISIQQYYPTCNIVLAVSEKSKLLIEKFPLEMTCRLDFFNCSNILASKFNTIRKFLHTLNDISHYAVEKYGRCLFVNEFLCMVNKIEIPDCVESNGFGFTHRYSNSHNKEESKIKEYTFELIFMNNLTFIKNLANLIKEKYDIDISNINDKYKEINIPNYYSLPLNYINKYDTKVFLNKQSCICTEDFFSYKNEIKLKDIKSKLEYHGKPISFVGIRFTDPGPNKIIMKFNNKFLTLLSIYQTKFIQVIQIKKMNEKMLFLVPVMKSIGIWSRERCPLGFYQLVDHYVKKYSEFFTKKEEAIPYFSLNGCCLYEKPDIKWLTKNLKAYYKILCLNSDNEVLEELNSNFSFPSEFLHYYADYPIDIQNFRDSNDILNNERTNEKLSVGKILKNGKTRYPATGRRGMLYKTLIKLLYSHRYAHMRTHDMGLMMTLIGVGTIPILKNAPKKPFVLLEENVHYLIYKPNAKPLSKKKYVTMRKNLNDFYEQHLHPEKVLRKLMNNLFKGNIE